MIIFIDTKKLGNFLYDLIESESEHERKIQEKIENRRKAKLKEKREKKLKKIADEEKKLNEWREQYCKDPTSVMICPFGWSPFGIYL